MDLRMDTIITIVTDRTASVSFNVADVKTLVRFYNPDTTAGRYVIKVALKESEPVFIHRQSAIASEKVYNEILKEWEGLYDY